MDLIFNHDKNWFINQICPIQFLKSKYVKIDDIKQFYFDSIVFDTKVKHNEIKPNEVKHNEIKPNEIEHNEIEHNTVEHNEIEHNEIEPNEIEPNEIEHNEIKHNTSKSNTIELMVDNDVSADDIELIKSKHFTKYDIETIKNIKLTEGSQRRGVIGENTIKSLLTSLNYEIVDNTHRPHCCDLWVILDENVIVCVEIKNKKTLIKNDYDKYTSDLINVEQITNKRVYGLFLSILTPDELKLNIKSTYISGTFINHEVLKMYFENLKLIVEFEKNRISNDEIKQQINNLNDKLKSFNQDISLLDANNSMLTQLITNNNIVKSDLEAKVNTINGIKINFDIVEVNKMNVKQQLIKYVMSNQKSFKLSICKQIVGNTILFEDKFTKSNILNYCINHK